MTPIQRHHAKEKYSLTVWITLRRAVNSARLLFRYAATIAGTDTLHEGEQCQSRVSVVCGSRERSAKNCVKRPKNQSVYSRAYKTEHRAIEIAHDRDVCACAISRAVHHGGSEHHCARNCCIERRHPEVRNPRGGNCGVQSASMTDSRERWPVLDGMQAVIVVTPLLVTHRDRTGRNTENFSVKRSRALRINNGDIKPRCKCFVCHVRNVAQQ